MIGASDVGSVQPLVKEGQQVNKVRPAAADVSIRSRSSGASSSSNRPGSALGVKTGVATSSRSSGSSICMQGSSKGRRGTRIGKNDVAYLA